MNKHRILADAAHQTVDAMGDKIQALQAENKRLLAREKELEGLINDFDIKIIVKKGIWNMEESHPEVLKLKEKALTKGTDNE